jgi:hypothetical protein
MGGRDVLRGKVQLARERTVIIKGGPGKITLPDGTVVAVVFEAVEIRFLLTSQTQATWDVRGLHTDLAGRVKLTVDAVETVEMG